MMMVLNIFSSLFILCLEGAKLCVGRKIVWVEGHFFGRGKYRVPLDFVPALCQVLFSILFLLEHITTDKLTFVDWSEVNLMFGSREIVTF